MPHHPLVLVALALAVGLAAPAAAGAFVHCTPTLAAGCDDAHPTVQDALDHAAAGDTVLVSGVETMVGRPAVDCGAGAVCLRAHLGGLTLRGVNGAVIEVNGVARYGIVVEADDVTVTGLTVRGVDMCCGQGAAIAVRGDRVRVAGNVLAGGPPAAPGQQYFGVLVQRCGGAAATDAVVEGNDVAGWNWGGIGIGGPVGCATGGVVRENVVRDNRTHGIVIDRAPGVLVETNVVTGTAVNPLTGVGAGVAVYGLQAAGAVIQANAVADNDHGVLLGSTTTIAIVGNAIRANGVGVVARVERWLLDRSPAQSADVVTVEVRGNDIAGNVAGGVDNQAEAAAGNGGAVVAAAIDARCNWWGDARGPADGARRTEGDGVSAHVASTPWLRHSIEHGRAVCDPAL